MTAVTYTGTLVGSDGSKLTVRDAEITPATVPLPPPASMDRQVSVYLKMWDRLGGPTLADAAKPGITEVRLAFLQGLPLGLVGRGCQDWTGLRTDAATLSRRGVQVTASIGGESGAVSTVDREGCLRGIGQLHASIGLDRIDWDVEASALRADDVLAITQAAHDRWDLLATMAPNGSNVSTYLPVAVELHRRGLLAAYGQQFYGSFGGVTLDDTRWRVFEAVKAGLPARLIQVGMWVGNGTPKRWPLTTCVTNMTAIRKEWPDIGGVYAWSEPPQSEVAEWAAKMVAVLT